MRSGLIEVLDTGTQDTMQLLLLQDEQVIETLAPHTAQKAFTDGIGPWRVIGRFQDLNAAGLGNPRESHPKLAIIISDEVLWPYTKGSGFPQLLRGPSIRGRSCDADVDHSAGVQFDNEEGEQRAEEEIGDREEVAGPDLLSMGVEEGLPGLSTWPGGAHGSHVLLNGPLADAYPQLEQFASDALCSPESVVPGHLLNQGHRLCGEFRLRRCCSGLVFPVELETLAMPAQQRLWLNDEEGLLPGACHPGQKHKEHA